MRRRNIVLGTLGVLIIAGLASTAGSPPEASPEPPAVVTGPADYDLGGKPDFGIAIDYMTETGDCEGLTDLRTAAAGRTTTARFDAYLNEAIVVTC